MDDFNVSSLHESKNEWGARLLTIITPHMVEGLHSIFDEAFKLCKDNNELDKYLMTFQNFITRIPKWNASIIENERKRIVEKSGCGYLEDLITCVHIIQLKLLTAMRAGSKQKKINISIPKIDEFIHKAYINVARKVYKNVYLFEMDIPALQKQKNFRELELIVQESILNTVRESIPVETILQAYMDETMEEDVVEEIKEQIIEDPNPQPQSQGVPAEQREIVSEESSKITGVQDNNDERKTLESFNIETIKMENDISGSGGIKFDNVDYVRDSNNRVESINAPKDIERLEEISAIRNAQRRLESEDDDEDDGHTKLKIHDQTVNLGNLDVHNIDANEISIMPDLLLDDIEVLV
jgi:hypothetical protein